MRAIDRFWRCEAPPERLAMLRILAGGFALVYLAARTPELLGMARFEAAQLAPVGVVSILDAPLAAGIWRALVIATGVLGIGFAAGYRYRVTGPLFALLLLWTLSYRNSWGMIFHTENLLVLHVGLLALAPAADAWSIDARRGRRLASDLRAYGWVIRLMCLVTCLAYLLAGIAKLRYGGEAWAAGDVLRHHVAIDAARKQLLGSVASPLAAPLIGHGWLFAVLAVATMVLELGAPAAMLGKRVAAIWVIGVLGFHYGVLALMAIGFPYPMSGIAFASFFRVERLAAILDRGWIGRQRGLRSSRSARRRDEPSP